MITYNYNHICLKVYFYKCYLKFIFWYHERFQYHIQAFVKSIFMEKYECIMINRNGNILTEDSEIVKRWTT